MWILWSEATTEMSSLWRVWEVHTKIWSSLSVVRDMCWREKPPILLVVYTNHIRTRCLVIVYSLECLCLWTSLEGMVFNQHSLSFCNVDTSVWWLPCAGPLWTSHLPSIHQSVNLGADGQTPHHLPKVFRVGHKSFPWRIHLQHVEVFVSLSTEAMGCLI